MALIIGNVPLRSAGLDTSNIPRAEEGSSSFARMLEGAIQEVNSLQVKADEAAVALATGQASDLHDVVIAMEKANLAFQLTLQIRNKLLEAYQEIMRTQV